MTAGLATPLLAEPHFELPAVQAIGRLRFGGVDGQLPRLARKFAGLLVVSDGARVSYDEFVEELWGGDFTGNPSLLQCYAMEFRKIIRDIPGLELVTMARGYCLEVSQEVDIVRFQREMQRVHALMHTSRFEEALTLLLDLRELSSRHLLEDVDCGLKLSSHLTKYEDYRRTILKYLYEIMIRHNRDEEILDDLFALWRRYPFCEDIAELLMLALHRCRRSAQATKVYLDTCRLLREEYGLEPNPRLPRLFHLVLNGTYPLSLDGPALAG